MARLLTAARARVAASDRSAYLGVLAELASRLGEHRHLWVFERRGHAGEFLEFREGPDDASHPARPDAAPDTALLAARLAALASYDDDRDILWDEITLHEPGGD